MGRKSRPVGLTRSQAEEWVREIVADKLSEVSDSDLETALEALIGTGQYFNNYFIVSRPTEGVHRETAE